MGNQNCYSSDQKDWAAFPGQSLPAHNCSPPVFERQWPDPSLPQPGKETQPHVKGAASPGAAPESEGTRLTSP